MTALNLNMRGAPIPRVSGDAGQCFSVKVEQMGGAKFEGLALRVDECLNHLNNRIELPEAVQRLLPRERIWISDDLGLEGTAMPGRIQHYRETEPDLNTSACSSTISRVMRSFSIWVFP
ncbi:MAG: hypothetical protein ABSF53_15850 [Terracidiphilus sp.]